MSAALPCTYCWYRAIALSSPGGKAGLPLADLRYLAPTSNRDLTIVFRETVARLFDRFVFFQPRCGAGPSRTARRQIEARDAHVRRKHLRY